MTKYHIDIMQLQISRQISDLMSQRLSSKEMMNISQCDVNGVLQANQWKLVNNDNTPDNPNEDEVSCY